MITPGPQTLSPFVFRPTQAERAAAAALVRLRASDHHRDIETRIYAAVVARAKYDLFRHRYKVRPRRPSHVCLYRLLGAWRCPDTWEHPCDSPMMLPGQDHMSEWVREGHTYCLVSQPYSWDWHTMCQTVDLGRQLGFEVCVNAGDSWHFPGWTTLVMYTKK